jgi:hypothetical protein
VWTCKKKKKKEEKRSAIEQNFKVWKNSCRILKLITSYDIKDQTLPIVATPIFHNFIIIHNRNDKGFKRDKGNSDNF